MLDSKARDIVKGTVGIYELKDNEEIVYIGASINIRSRIIKHIKNEEKCFNDFSYEICDKKSLFIKEAFAISKHNPKYNKRRPPLDTTNSCPSERIEKRDITTAFSAKKSEKVRIKEVAELLDIGMSEFMRNAVMKEVVKQEKLLFKNK